ncbi:tyrosine-type recombinase/integrase [Aureimonas phyllosphaerae]|uniref:tyrosine-type recombinase/integrase n=1 Tax=Aureimonas phyllosphaerae TaxID=1166078 RepID=UPI003A5BA8D0
MPAAPKNEIDTPSKRARLIHRKNPYWLGVSGGRGGVSLGYRTSARGNGAWIAKIVVEGTRLEERLGDADDDGAPAGAMTYRAAVATALDWSRRQTAAIEAREGTQAPAEGQTVRSAVEHYGSARKARAPAAGKITEDRLRKHVLADEAFAKIPLAKLRASSIDAWRGRLALRNADDEEGEGAPLAPATINRLLNDLRAALNAAAERHRRELPPHLPNEIKVGTRAVSVENEARRQLLTDEEVGRIVAAAFQVDDTGDFGRMVLTAAATGARHAQLQSLRVGDVQPARQRVMMPGSKKGRSTKAKAPVPVPLAPEHLVALEPALAGRRAEDPLLERWAFKRAKAPARWERDKRRPWGPAYELGDLWAATIAKAEVPADTIPYALRHSSIVRGLRAGLPIRLVAALHDTSVEMIEAHYSAFIADATEELARRAVLSFSVG